MKHLFPMIFMAFIGSTYAEGESEYEKFQNARSDALATDVKQSNYAAVLRPISFFVLEEDLPKIEKCDYYNHITVYEVVESYKGDLPEYILMKGFGEYCQEYKGKRYRIESDELKIRAFCKGGDHYYFPRTHYMYRDTPLLRRTALDSSQEKTVPFENTCNKEHWLSK